MTFTSALPANLFVKKADHFERGTSDAIQTSYTIANRCDDDDSAVRLGPIFWDYNPSGSPVTGVHGHHQRYSDRQIRKRGVRRESDSHQRRTWYYQIVCHRAIGYLHDYASPARRLQPQGGAARIS